MSRETSSNHAKCSWSVCCTTASVCVCQWTWSEGTPNSVRALLFSFCAGAQNDPHLPFRSCFLVSWFWSNNTARIRSETRETGPACLRKTVLEKKRSSEMDETVASVLRQGFLCVEVEVELKVPCVVGWVTWFCRACTGRVQTTAPHEMQLFSFLICCL